MHSDSLISLHRLVWTAMCAALIGVGAYAVIPLGPIPFSMQPMFVCLAGYVLGPVSGAASVGLYLAAGSVGLPVFQRGMGGLAHLLGPTGGFLFGFVLLAACAGLAARRDGGAVRWLPGLAWGLVGLVALYACGAVWLKVRLDWDWSRTLLTAVVPFFPLGILKLGLALGCARVLARSRLLPLAARP
ncbi:MAG: biotin transporter BioY [Desulfovibrionaceae bacterium]